MQQPQPEASSVVIKPRIGLKRVIAGLLTVLLAEAGCYITVLSDCAPRFIDEYKTLVLCGITGGVGGVVYCLRAVYLNACVKKSWDETWLAWYFIRPVVSLVCGFVSYAFLKAGLLVLESAPKPDGSQFGFFVLAFVAGLNVDKFVGKIEDVAQTTWGIEKSRTATKENNS